MSVSNVRDSKQFGKKQEPRTITISNNGKVQQYKVSAFICVFAFCVFAMSMIGYVGATGYLAFRDDLIASTIVRQSRLKQEYEDRIASLRSKVDIVTSRQLLDQRAVESKVSSLIQQQELLQGRSDELNILFDRAKQSGLDPDKLIGNDLAAQNNAKLDLMQTGSINRRISGAAKPLKSSAITFGIRGSQPSIGDNKASANEVQLALLPSNKMPSGAFSTDATTPSQSLFGAVNQNLSAYSDKQLNSINLLREEATRKSKDIVGVFAKLNIPLSKKLKSNIGGPFEPAKDEVDFHTLTDDLKNQLETLDKLRRQTHILPVGSPVYKPVISSRFGNRTDPFKRKTAFHSGIDFKAPSGKSINAAGSGKVIKAERSGGYGLMVVIDHGNGLTTRYAHMRRMSVSVGQVVGRGKKIGEVGSTGRSTGPHLHFEIRRHGKATNPMSFFKMGKKLNSIL